MALVDVVDENDTVIGVKEYHDCTNKDIKRCAGVMIFNSKEEILFQQRSFTDDKYPGRWDIAGSGCVDSGESYEVAAKRECLEEIGIEVEKMEKVVYYLFDDVQKGRKYYSTIYKAYHEGPFTVDSHEVEKVEFFSMDIVKEMMKDESLFHPELYYILKNYFI